MRTCCHLMHAGASILSCQLECDPASLQVGHLNKSPSHQGSAGAVDGKVDGLHTVHGHRSSQPANASAEPRKRSGSLATSSW